MRTLWAFFLLAVFFSVNLSVTPAARAGEGTLSADIVIKNARVYTMDTARRWQQSVAVRADRIVYVGTDDGAASHIGPATRVIDARGGMVMPGMFDCHVHLADGGVHLNECNLDDCKTGSAVLKKVKDYAASKPDLEWIRGAGWSLPLFEGGNPSKKDLDEIIPDRPVFLESQDYHSGWANSAALARAGITHDTRDPEGGRIERDEKGEPTGTLRETAMHIIQKLIPERSRQDYAAGLRRGQELANRMGITSIQDAWVNMELLTAYLDLEREGELKVRVSTAWKIDPEKDFAAQVHRMRELRDRYSSEMVSFSSAKLFADGVIEAHTAALIEPYSGIQDKTERDELNFPGGKMKEIVALLERNGFQVHVHAIGDRAVRTTLDAFQHSRKNSGAGLSLRHHIAHLELIDSRDIPRFRELGVTATVQPFWCQRDKYIEELTEPVLGPERSRDIYPLGALYASGARLAGGSDWPVSSLNPFDAMEVAVRRAPPGDAAAESWLPHQKIALQACLEAYTINGAFVNHCEDRRGSIEAGKDADLIILDRDLFAVSPETIHETRVLMTILGGRIVHRDGGLLP